MIMKLFLKNLANDKDLNLLEEKFQQSGTLTEIIFSGKYYFYLFHHNYSI